MAEMVKRHTLAGGFAAHSLRAGFATEAYARGRPEVAITRHGRRKSATVMCGHIEARRVWVRQRGGTPRLVGLLVDH